MTLVLSEMTAKLKYLSKNKTVKDLCKYVSLSCVHGVGRHIFNLKCKNQTWWFSAVERLTRVNKRWCRGIQLSSDEQQHVANHSSHANNQRNARD